MSGEGARKQLSAGGGAVRGPEDRDVLCAETADVLRWFLLQYIACVFIVMCDVADGQRYITTVNCELCRHAQYSP